MLGSSLAARCRNIYFTTTLTAKYYSHGTASCFLLRTTSATRYFSTKSHTQNAGKATILQTFLHNLRIAPRTSCVSDVSLATNSYPFFREIVPLSGETMSYFYTRGSIEDIYDDAFKKAIGTSDGSLDTSDGSLGTSDG